MRVIVLAGGYATRLWPLTLSKPKPLLPLAGRPIIDYIMNELSELSCKEIIISTNRAFAPHFRRWLSEDMKKTSIKERIRLFIEDTTSEEEKLGTIAALERVMEYFGKDHYLIIAGDNVFSYRLLDFYKAYDMKNPLIAVYDIVDKSLVPMYSQVVTDESGRIIEFEEKPKTPKTTLIATACYAFPPDTLDLIKEYLSLGLKRDSPGFFIQWLYRRRPVYTYMFKGYWFDIGAPRTYLEANEALLKKTFISENADVSESVEIIDPVYIDDNVFIKGKAKIGPYTYIGPESIIEESEISKSIVMRGSEIACSRIFNSIVGERVVLRSVSIKDSVIGDYVKVYGLKE